MYIVYKTLNNINGKYYIGVHNSNTDNYLGSGKGIKQAIKKYGRDSFSREIIIETENMNFAYSEEQRILGDRFKTDKKCYNMIRGGKVALAGRLNETDIKERLKLHAIDNSKKNVERYHTDKEFARNVRSNLDKAREIYKQKLIDDPGKRDVIRYNNTGVNSPSYGSKWYNDGIKSYILKTTDHVPEHYSSGRLPWVKKPL